MNYSIVHRTTYDYSEPVSVSYHAARFEPLSNGTQTCSEFALAILPPPAVKKSRDDYFGNHVTFFGLQETHLNLEIIARSKVSISRAQTPDTQRSTPFSAVRNRFRDPVSPDDVESYEFCLASPMIGPNPEFAAFAHECFAGDPPVLEGIRNLTRRIHREFKYDPKATTVATPVEEVWQVRRGVCQDFAHLAIAALRSLGLPARYVSGYLRTMPPPGSDRLVGADASHAWFSAFCPGVGWVDFDPTNDLLVGEDHIAVAFGRDFSDVSPLTGIITGGGVHTVDVGVDVVPL